MFSIIFFVAAAHPTPLTLPLETPLYCADSKGVDQPIARTASRRPRRAFACQFGFGGHLSQPSPTAGTLWCRGRTNGAEKSISYSIEAHDGEVGRGMTLVTQDMRLRFLAQNLRGDNLCGRSFGIVNDG